HWATNMRNPVHFQHAITHAATDHHTFIEISPHPLLTQAVLETLYTAQHGTKYACVATLQRDTDDTITFRTNRNRVHTTHPPQTPHLPEPHPRIPTTPWQHTRHWLSPASLAAPAPNAMSPHESAAPTSAPSDYLGGALDAWCHRVRWVVTPAAGPPAWSGGTGRWLVIGDAELGRELAEIAGAQSHVDVAPSALLDVDALGTALSGADHVVYAPAADTAVDPAPAYELFGRVRRLVAAMTAGAGPARLFLVTRNAQPVTEGDHASPAHGALWGLGRTLALEHPEIWGGIIDLDASVPAEVAAPQVLREVGGGDGEDQVVYRGGARRVPRLQRHTVPVQSPVTLGAGTCQLVIGATGNIGPHLIRQLARMGATTIVAVSRNPGQRLAALT
ncbi:acyltransferase domain-containing protein, partial [Mycobacterium sherrisii]|uniref:acyltransferase domain-containing protein n=1 Tax=Mycobacterium sherrisii TaxID=243061 RepID=UPI0012F4AFDB